MREKHYGASEQRDADTVLAILPEVEEYLPVLLKRLEPYCDRIRPGARVLDIGAAQGMFVTVLKQNGYDAYGVEPWQEAIETSKEVSKRTGVETDIVEGWGEDLPYDSGMFDLVLAVSVMEHVKDVMDVFREVHRVLRPGGGFYFYTGSKLAPIQDEIQGFFPLFPWYPKWVQRRIMDWAVRKRPDLVGGTSMPAYHWFTPWGLKRDLRAAGFSRVLERWDLKREEELAGWRRTALRTVRSSRALRLAGEVAAPGSGYLAIK